MPNKMVSIKCLNFLIFSTLAILLPNLPLLLMQRKFSAAEIGIIMMIGPFFSAFSQPAIGFMSDRFGVLKQIAVTLWFLTGVCLFGVFYIDITIVCVFLVVFLFMFFFSLIPLMDTMSVQIAKQYHASYSGIRLWGAVGFTAACILKSMCPEKWSGPVGLMIIYLPVWLIALFLLFKLQVCSEHTPLNSQKIRIGDIITLLSNKTICMFLISVLFLSIPHRMNDAILSIFLKGLGGNERVNSLAWMLLAVGEVIGFYIATKLLKRFHYVLLLVVAASMYVVRWITSAYVTDLNILVVLQSSHAVTYSLFWTAAVHYITVTVTEQSRATSQSLLSMVFLGISGIIGGSIGGELYEHLGSTAMYTFGFICAAIAVIGFFMLWRNDIRIHQKSSVV